MDSKKKTVLIIGTCDTKGDEILFMRGIIESKGLQCLVLDMGLLKDPANFKAEIPREQLAKAADRTLEELVESAMKGRYEVAVEELGRGAVTIIKELYKDGKIDGALAIGGSMGTALSLKMLRAIPVGFPKVLISTVALSEYVHSHWVRSDITLVQPILDFWGLDSWAKRDLRRAALAIAAMVPEEEPMEEGRWIGMTAIGWLSPCIFPVKRHLEENGFKVAMAHSVSMQGGIVEQLIRQGVIKGMADLCPFEVLHEVAGGACHSPNRMTAASEMGIPQVVGPGAMGVFTMSTLDMQRFTDQGRFTVEHNEILGTAKPTIEEMAESAKLMASHLNASKGKTAIVVPQRGFFGYDNEGKMYYNPEGRKAFTEALKDNLSSQVELTILDCHWDDPEYAGKVSEVCLRLFKDIP
ncbi:MAG: hypothetical protein C0392_13405 [Syntrophus sp. (in: bacteria)]|nr:hypothetical protein [Syntrophus sp. (in: bacteria)]